MISNAAKYAIRAVLYLAKYSDTQNKIGSKTIAKDIQAPSPFLAKLLRDLASKEIISSSKGPTGGFYLTDKDKHKNILNIIINIDGTTKFDSCFLGLSRCDDQNPCPVHYIVSPFKEQILADFKEKTINELANDIEANKTLISLKGLDIN